MSCISAHYTEQDSVYVVGSIQAEKKHECDSKDMFAHFRIAVHNTTLVSLQILKSLSSFMYQIHLAWDPTKGTRGGGGSKIYV